MTGPIIVADAYGERTRQIAEALMATGRNAGEPVRYGSGDWHRLDRRDPRWLAAVIHYAEAWRQYVDPINVALDLLDELARDREELRQLSIEISQAANWLAVANCPTHAELQRRRSGAA